MVVTDDDAVAERVRALRNHGMVAAEGHPRFELAGFNYRMTDFQGALGAVQMGRLEGIIARRTESARRYDQALAEIDSIIRPTAMAGARHIWQSYVILLHEDLQRDDVVRFLKEQGVEATLGTYAVSVQPHYAGTAGVCPNSRRAYEQSVCLPLHTQMSAADVEEVTRCLRKAVRLGQ
jgi:dTDP-4-amino-4,6-dideoxygalactose transaminase